MSEGRRRGWSIKIHDDLWSFVEESELREDGVVVAKKHARVEYYTRCAQNCRAPARSSRRPSHLASDLDDLLPYPPFHVMLAKELNHTKDLEPLDPEYVSERLSKPPFVTVPGVFNIRDLGCYPSSRHSGMITRPRLLYRSAEISSITDEGM